MSKKKYIIGNWKSNKTMDEGRVWIETFQKILGSESFDTSWVEIVICPSAIHLPVFNYFITQNKLPLGLGVQDVSPFPAGAYTGAVAATQLVGLAEWVIIGHSERRTHFGETDAILAQKVSEAQHNKLKVIYCVPGPETVVPPGVDIVAYEPVWAIGTGKTETPENAAKIATTIKEKTNVSQVIYGGSVTDENVSSFTQQEMIDGVLAGGASLDAAKFVSLIMHAIKHSQA